MQREATLSGAVRQVRLALWLYVSLVVLVTAAAWTVYGLSRDILTHPLSLRSDEFHDLTNYATKMAHLRDGAVALGSGLPDFTYPAPAVFVYKVLLYAFPGHGVRTYLALLVVCIAGFAVVTWRAVRSNSSVRIAAGAAILVTAVLGYPTWFAADRGNIEIFVWAISAAGLCFLLRGRYGVAAVLIGVAAAIKPFPLILLLLLLGRRKYKEAVLGMIVTGLVTLAALIYVGPNPWKAYQDLAPGVSFYVSRYILNLSPIEEGRFLHSLLDAMKSGALAFDLGGSFQSKFAVEEVTRLRSLLGGWHVILLMDRLYPFIAVPGFVVLMGVVRRMPILNQMTAVCVAMTLFPLSAGDYTLVDLYVPFGALLVFLVREVATGRVAMGAGPMAAFAVVYGLLFAPLTFLKMYAGDAKTVLLLALLVVVVRTPMRTAYFADRASIE